VAIDGHGAAVGHRQVHDEFYCLGRSSSLNGG
jgi:hypothetical protein